MNEPVTPSESSVFESKAAFIARMIRSRILSGEFPEGHSLRQRELADMFDVSATPVREALSQLQAEGYVVARLHQGCIVRALEERMVENWRLRAALEAVAAELAAENMDDAGIAEIRRRSESFAEATDEIEAHRLNQELHFAIYRRAHAPVLMRFLSELWATLDISPTARRAHAASVAEHTAIVEALARGDGRAAAEYTRLHISGTAPRPATEQGAVRATSS